MAYTTLTEVKSYLGIGTTTDDTLLAALIVRAQKIIDIDRNRTFEARTETHYYRYKDTHGDTLYIMDDDLLTVTTLTNGDAAGSVITSGYYWLLPRNASPKYAIQLKSSKYWQQDTDYEIGVAGTWGYTAAAPADIAQACVRLTAYLYRNKDSQVFDVTATPELGIMTIPKGMPVDVRLILDRYPYRGGLA